MNSLLLSACLLLPASFVRADETAAPSSGIAKMGTPVETVKVTDQEDPGLFVRVRDAHIRAEKKGALAAAVSNPR